MNPTASPPLFREIPLSRLELAPENVRRTPPDEAADAQLRASIEAHGLLENLVARAGTPDDDGAERFAVIAGGRRLAALKALAGDGALDADHPVPCLVAGNGDAGELSLAENVVRVAMHPADQVVAFSGLAEAGATVAAIAARFGVSERIVEQRLRLGNAAPELLDAYRAGDIDLETLRAFSITADRGRQLAAWQQVSGQGYRPAAWQVKRLLTDERVPATAALARFVGVEAYEAAGGAVLRDLFADEYENGVWLEDPALLNELAMTRLRSFADELATRWKWARAVPELDWTVLARYGRVEPVPAAPTDEEKAEIERLETRHDELVNLDDDDWTDELVAEAAAIEARLDEIEGAVEARATFSREDFRIAGAIATVGRDGALQVVQGLVRPEDMPKQAAAANGHAVDTGNGDATEAAHAGGPAVSAPAAPPRDPHAAAREEAGVGIGLADDLRAIRTALVKARLAGDFEAAFDLVLFQAARAVFGGGYHADALDITVKETPDRPTTRMNDEDFAARSPGEAMLADLSRLPLAWMERDGDAARFAALRALPRADKEALFAAAVARTVRGQLAFEHGARPELEATVARLDIDFAAQVRPTADLLWSRLRKDRMLDIARLTFGAAWASARARLRKADLAKAMEQAFAAGDRPLGLSASQHAAALAWTPPGFVAFDTGRAVGDAGDAPSGKPEPEEPSAAGSAPPDAPPASNGNGAASAPEAEPPNGDAANAGRGDTGEAGPDPAVAGVPAAIAGTGPVNGQAAHPDPMEIPEFLCRVQ